MRHLLFFCGLFFLNVYQISACSAFMLKSDRTLIAAKNYDWEVEHGMIIINKRGVYKTALADTLPLSWCSRYGSVTFNQYGQEFPCGGMNEKGLVIEALWLNETSYPPPEDNVPRIDNMQWIQYQLDNASGIEDIIKNDSFLQIAPLAPTAVHCFIADRSGNALIFESINGELHHYRAGPDSLPILTNNPYDYSMRMLKKCTVFGGNLQVPRGKGSITRFIHLGIAIDSAKKLEAPPRDKAFRILRHVSLGGYTKWSTVYDLHTMNIHYRSRSRKKIKSISFNRISFDCDDTVLAAPLINKWTGDISSRFTPFSLTDNFTLVKTSIRKTRFLKNIPVEQLKRLADAPSENVCK